jgi:hypothetical protein
VPESDDHTPTHLPPDPIEERLRKRLRVISGFTFLGLIVLLALADTFGRAAGLRASEFLFGALIGGLLLIASVEGAAALVRRL